MKIGEVFRYARPYSDEHEIIDDLPNYFFHTKTHGKKLLLDRGINTPADVVNQSLPRRPVILLRSSPNKAGSETTPWQDIFDPDNGHVRYFGDNKLLTPARAPEEAQGNKLLLEQFNLYESSNKADRKLAAPILCFKTVYHNKFAKGVIQFEGFGIINKIERITQKDTKTSGAFTNYVYDLAIFDMSQENETLPWSWIQARFDPKKSIEDCNSLAPDSWKRWVKNGSVDMEKCRRRVSKLLVTKTAAQTPSDETERKLLDTVYDHYSNKKARFEALAAVVAERVIQGDGAKYKTGWITAASSDGGADFIGRLDIGSSFSTAKIIVLGQAKCEKLNTPTGGNHIARTVARLRRGWIGVYVTTSYFSEAVQREVIEDKYPLLLINGKRIAYEVAKMLNEKGYKEVERLLDEIDDQYDQMLAIRSPEEILTD